MLEDSKYYVIKKKAVPEVLLKVLEVQKLLDAEQAKSIQEATETVGISRSSYYKYKDDIFPFHASKKGRNITFVIEVEDQPGVMATVLQVFANYKANILTIHQSIPVNGVATLTLSVEVLETTGNVSRMETDVSAMIESVEKLDNITYVKIIAKE